ncbi:MAG: formimidoylglutamase [Phycisphaerae bacterium]|nr:formimidoylglutamase [Phycisphaerae bacterium]
MVPHTAPPVYPPIPPGRLAGAIVTADADAPRSPDGCRVALLGLPDDTGVAMNHGRPGAREGPHAFRSALSRYGVAAQGDGLHLPRVFDAGDVLPGKSLHETHDRVSAAVSRLLDLGLLPVAVGGGHDLTWPLVRAVHQRSPLSRGLYLDAHLDVRPEPGSGMAFRRILEDLRLPSLVNIGANPIVNAREHWQWFLSKGGEIHPVGPGPDAIDESRLHPERFVCAGPGFVSIDLDAIDAASAPGVSALNPAGLSPRTAERFAFAAGRCPDTRCFDLMELNPSHDRDHQTARLAVHLFITFLRGCAERFA